LAPDNRDVLVLPEAVLTRRHVVETEGSTAWAKSPSRARACGKASASDFALHDGSHDAWRDFRYAENALTSVGSEIMLKVRSAAIGQPSLLDERPVEQPRVAAPPLAATIDLSRRSFLAAGVGAGSVLWAKAARPQTGIWREYRRDDVGFRIEMPGEPRVRIQNGRAADNWTTSTDVQVRYQHEIFDLSWTEFKEVVAVEDEYTRFRELMTGAGYQLQEDIPLTLDDVPAREFIIETGDINFVRRIMAVRNLAIAIHALGARNVRNSPTVRRFLDSFKLLRT
jgi:hypothetical protein